MVWMVVGRSGRALGLAFGVALFSMGCEAQSDSDGDDESGRFSDVDEWDCYSNADTGLCYCFGLGAGDGFAHGGSAISETDACAGFSECRSHYDTEREMWMCTCGPTGFALDAEQMQIEPAAACPP